MQLLRQAAVLSVVIVGCTSALGDSLEGKACSQDGVCLAGFVCNAQRVCVLPEHALWVLPEVDAGRLELDGAVGHQTYDVRSPSWATATAFNARPPDGGDDASAELDATTPADAAVPVVPQTPPLVQCPKERASCAGTCVDLQNDPRHCGACATACPVAANASAVCDHGTCKLMCDHALTTCPASPALCVDLQSDANNCGKCGNVCSGLLGIGGACAHGACTLLCALGTSICGGACVDLSEDPVHCGSCGKRCGKDQVCASGRCVDSKRDGKD